MSGIFLEVVKSRTWISPDGLMLQGAQLNVLVLVRLKVDGQVAIMVPALGMSAFEGETRTLGQRNSRTDCQTRACMHLGTAATDAGAAILPCICMSNIDAGLAEA